MNDNNNITDDRIIYVIITTISIIVLTPTIIQCIFNPIVRKEIEDEVLLEATQHDGKSNTRPLDEITSKECDERINPQFESSSKVKQAVGLPPKEYVTTTSNIIKEIANPDTKQNKNDKNEIKLENTAVEEKDTKKQPDSNWRCVCETGFLPPGMLKNFGSAEAMIRLGTGSCYHKK